MKIKLLLTTLLLFASQSILSGECKKLLVRLPDHLSTIKGRECNGGQDHHAPQIVKDVIVYAKTKERSLFYKVTHEDGSVCEHMRYNG